MSGTDCSPEPREFPTTPYTQGLSAFGRPRVKPLYRLVRIPSAALVEHDRTDHTQPRSAQHPRRLHEGRAGGEHVVDHDHGRTSHTDGRGVDGERPDPVAQAFPEIGRASCRERVWMSVGAG